ncbi:MAG: hypothetical protein ACOCV4_07750 [Myxococcota bacterium]
MPFRTVAASLVAAVALTAPGCGGAEKTTQTAADVRSSPPADVDLLPEGAFVYGRVDLDRLRASRYADRAVGWYREFVPAIPGFDPDHPGTSVFEETLPRVKSIAAAGFAPAGEYSPGADTLGQHGGVVALVRGDVDLAFVERSAERLDLELVQARHAGRETLTTPDPAGEQLLVVALEPGLLAFVAGRLEDAEERLRAVVARLEAGAEGLAVGDLESTADAVELRRAPLGLVTAPPESLREEIAHEVKMGELFAPDLVMSMRHFGMRFDPSDGLLLESVAQMEGAEPAGRLARSVERMAEQNRENAFVLLLGFDLWLDHTETRVDGDRVRATMRVPHAEMETWFFHVEHLAAAAKAFFLQGALGELFGGFGGSPPPPAEPVPSRREDATETKSGTGTEKATEAEAQSGTGSDEATEAEAQSGTGSETANEPETGTEERIELEGAEP